MVYPRMLRIRQQFDCPKVNDVAQSVHQELQRLDLRQMGQTGISDSRIGAFDLVELTQLLEMNQAVVGHSRPGQFDLFQIL